MRQTRNCGKHGKHHLRKVHRYSYYAKSDPPLFVLLSEDPRKRMNIAYYNSFERMEARLRNHVTSMPKIINSNLVQACTHFITKITFCLGSASYQRGPHEQAYSDRILGSGEKVDD